MEKDATMKLACKYCGYSSMDREDVRLHVEEEHPEELDRDRVVIDSVEYRPRGILVQFDPEGEAS